MHASHTQGGALTKVACAALLLLALSALAACSDSKSDSTPTPTSAVLAPTLTVVPSATAAPTATVAPSPTPVSAAQRLAKAAGYFVYKVRADDDIGTIAGLFNGEPGTAKAGYPQQILDANSVTSADLKAGLELAIPLLNTPGDIIPSAGLGGTLERATGTKIALLEPTAALRTAYSESIALHAIEVATGNAGYRMEYWLTATPFSATGTINRDAQVTTPLFVISSGTLLPAAGATGDIARFDRDGATYAVAALTGAKSSAAALVAMLQAAPKAP